jgi:hypothetical protein
VAEHGHRADARAIHCVGRQGERDPQAIYSGLGDDRVVCLCLPFPPQEGADSPGAEYLAGLVAGMPVIVWAREAVDPTRFCALVRDTLAREGLRDLPRRARWLRREAAQSAGSGDPVRFTPAVGLLWDDADRMPGYFRQSIWLHAPQ